jgi:hypothetical protein
LKNATLCLLKDKVTFTPSSFNTNISGGGRKSSTILIRPSGSFVYRGLRFIYFSAFSPIAGTENSDQFIAVGKTDRHNSICNFPEAVPTFLGLAVRHVFSDNARCIQEGELSFGETDAMLELVRSILGRIPLKA